ncbi:MAG TPA: DsbA family protein [Alphaproteobacteria bacterium]|nr:DsbA family protein [Alphaproteobacteria bacterium]
MSIFYRIIIILLVVAAGYSLFGIGHFKWMYYRATHPKADFTVKGDQQSDQILIEFLNYNCGYCKQINPTVKELLDVRKDIKYIARPVSFKLFIQDETDPEGEKKPYEDKTTKIVFAAGLQGKFWEMHDAVLEYPETDIPDSFFEETANLYGIDYDQLIKDSKSDKVEKIIDENVDVFNHIALYSVPTFMMNGNIYAVRNEKLPELKELLDFVSSAEKH